MLLNLTDVFTSAGKVKEQQVSLNMDSYQYQSSDYKVLEQTPVSLRFENLAPGKLRMTGKAEFVLEFPCDRCLKPVSKKIVLDFEREVYAPDELPEDSDDDQSFMDDYQLKVEDLISNEFVLNWPMKVLCKPDCKGICRVCGADLNTGACNCDTFVPDPRMAAINDIFNAKREV